MTRFDHEDACGPIAGDAQHRIDDVGRDVAHPAAIRKREERRRVWRIVGDCRDLRVWHRPERIEQRRADRPQRLHQRLSFRRAPGIAGHDDDRGRAAQRFRDGWRRRIVHETHGGRQRVGHGLRPLRIGAQRLLDLIKVGVGAIKSVRNP